MAELTFVFFDACDYIRKSYSSSVYLYPSSLCCPNFLTSSARSSSHAPQHKRRKTSSCQTPLQCLLGHIFRSLSDDIMRQIEHIVVNTNTDVCLVKENYHAGKVKLQTLDEMIKTMSKFSSRCTSQHEATIDDIDIDLSLFRQCLITNGSERVWCSAVGSFVIPANCCFHYGDLRQGMRLVQQLHPHEYGVIVVDPPWQNKSVRRGSKYQTNFSYSELLKLHVPELCCSSAALVAIWVTNSDSVYSFVTDELFPAWGLRHISTWLWLKVNAAGEALHDVESPHKKCYERLLIGIRGDRTADVQPTQQSEFMLSQSRGQIAADDSMMRSDHDNQVVPKLNVESHGDTSITLLDSFPCEFIISPPLRHSWKPAVHCRLRVALRNILPSPFDGRDLELFARELRPGCTSLGNEVLLFQMTNRVEKCTRDATMLSNKLGFSLTFED